MMEMCGIENPIAIYTVMLFSFLFLISFHTSILSVIAKLKVSFHYNFEKIRVFVIFKICGRWLIGASKT